jgi:beta-alanine--pyruvate transaminase
MDDALPRGDLRAPNNLESFWMPFTANRSFKAAPRLYASAKGMYYTTVDGRQVLDGTAGRWCVNAGHCHQIGRAHV